MELTQIVNKLVGQISATGDSSRDGERLESLKTMCNIVEGLIEEIQFSARDKDSYEGSVKQIGQYASNFLNNLKEELQ